MQAEIDRLEKRQMELRSMRSLMPTPGRDPVAEVRAELAQIEEALADAKERRAELRELRQDRESRSGAASAVSRRAEALVAEHGPRLADAEAEEPQLGEGETIPDAIGRIRGGIEDLRAELARVKDAGLTVAELKRRARAHVAWLAEQGRPRLEEGDEGLSILWPGLGAERHPTLDPVNPNGSPAAFAAWMAPDALIARLNAEIDAMPRDGLRLAPAEKAAKVAELEAAILDAERAEEALVERALAEGFAVARRPDADPRAVLGVRVVDKAETKQKEAA